MNALTKWLARAKVNLVLDVVGARADGYHELRSIFQSIELADVLTIEPAAEIIVDCDAPGIPAGPGNLAFRAAAALRTHCGVQQGCRISIEKHIPAGAGLGGGSADAAATLVALNELWQLGLSQAELMLVGATIGSDVPFTLRGGTCLGTGRGEVLTPQPVAGALPLAVVVPPVAVATAGAYKLVDEWADLSHPDPAAALRALADGDVVALAAALGNSFEEPVARAYPAVARALRTIRSVLPAPAGAVLSGSGAAVVVVGASTDALAELRRQLPDCFIWVGRTASAGVSPLVEN